MSTYLHGADRLDEIEPLLQNKRLGLITNPTGRDKKMRSTVSLLHEKYNLVRIYAPEHGLWGAIQAGERVDHETDPATGIPVQSLYGSHDDVRMDDIDVLLYDIQDVGLRFYTYIYVMEKGMRLAASHHIPFVVLDRMNPLGLSTVQGTLLEEAYSSGIGKFGLASRYGLTCGELAAYLADTGHLNPDLRVLPCRGLTRKDDILSLGLPFVQPSPNLPSVSAMFCYVGTVILEGTNLSEGRGTTRPFETFGAPFLHAEKLLGYIEAGNFKGALFRPVRFCPTFSKHAGKVCEGVDILLTDPRRFDAFRFGLYVTDYLRHEVPEFAYAKWGEKNAIDHILGTSAFRLETFDVPTFIQNEKRLVQKFRKSTEKYWIY